MQDYVMKCEEFDINLAENVRLFGVEIPAGK